MIYLCTVKISKNKWVLTTSDCSKYQEYQEPKMRGIIDMMRNDMLQSKAIRQQEFNVRIWGQGFKGIGNTNRSY